MLKLLTGKERDMYYVILTNEDPELGPTLVGPFGSTDDPERFRRALFAIDPDIHVEIWSPLRTMKPLEALAEFTGPEE